MNGRDLLSILTLCLVGGAVYLSILLIEPPPPLEADAPATAFSAERAMQHLEKIGRDPRPMGEFAARARARDYLLDEINALGLEVQVQDAWGQRLLGADSLIAGAVENIVVRVPGSDPEGAVLLIAHYDSTPGGPGAGDNGTGTVTLLEIMRALKAGPAMAQDVLALFVDGHEPGIIGTHAFVAQHPWAETVKVVINMDTLRNGPAQAIVSIDWNDLWVRALAAGRQRTAMLSLPYHLFPGGDSDVIPFIGRDVPGLTIRGAMASAEHHTTLDIIELVNPSTVQQAGEQVLAMVQTLGNQSNLMSSDANQTYFPIMGRLAHYPSRWALPLAAAASALCLGALIFGWRGQHLTVRGAGLGLLAFVIGLAASVILVFLLWTVIEALHPEYQYSSYRPRLSDDQLYMAGLLLAVLAVMTAVVIVARKRITALDLAAGTLAIWMGLAVAAALIVPGSSYLASWVLLAGSLALLWALYVQGRGQLEATAKAGFVVSAVLAIFLLVPVLCVICYGGPLASTMMLGMLVGLAALMLGAMLPALEQMSRARRWLLPAAAALASFALLLAGHVLVGGDSPPPMVNSIGYWLDAAKQEACWVAFIGGTRVDAHTSRDVQAGFPESMDERQRALLTEPVRRNYQELSPALPPFSVLTSPVVALPYAGPNLEVVADRWAKGRRLVDVSFGTSMRDRLYIIVPEAKVTAFALPGNERTEMAGEDVFWLRLDGMPEDGVDIHFEFATAEAIEFLLVEEKTGLPTFPGLATQAPPGTMQSPGEFEQGVPADFTAIYRAVSVPGSSRAGDAGRGPVS